MEGGVVGGVGGGGNPYHLAVGTKFYVLHVEKEGGF